MKLEEYINGKNILYKSKKSFKLFIKDNMLIIFVTLINPVSIPVLIANCDYGIQYLLIIILPIALLFLLIVVIIMRLTTNYVIFTEDEIIFYNIFKKIRKIIKYSEVSSYAPNVTGSVISINKNCIEDECDIPKILSIICQKCVFNSEQKQKIEDLKTTQKILKEITKWYIIITITISSGFAIYYHNKLFSFYYGVKGDILYNKYRKEQPVNKALMQQSYNYLLKSLSYNLSQSRTIWKDAIATAHYLKDFDKRDKMSQIAVNIYPNDLFFKEVTRDKKRFDDLIIPLDKIPQSRFRNK